MTRLCPKSRRMYLLALILCSILTGTCGKALADNNKTTGQAKVGIVASNPLSTPAPPPGKIYVWRLNQPDQMIGKRVIYIGQNGYRAAYTQGHYSMVSSAPKWDVTYYSSDQKLFCTKSMAQWKTSMNTRAKLFRDSLYPENWTVKPGKTIKILGHPCQSYVFASTKPVDAGSIAKSTIYVGQELVVPPKMSDFFAVTWGKNLSDHHMVRIELELGNGYKSTKLETKGIDKVLVDANFFDIPQGFKATQNESQITLGDGLINDIVNDLGKQLGTGKK
ncbi:MAG: hypothetical protein IPO31_14235 [Candidatus Obscuribacter sp.]|nr:hypothetical protein [Candidatus Obscuribacter sp.]